MVDIRTILSQAIQAGAPLYNQGLQDQCYGLYRECASSVLESLGVSPAAADALKEALEEASRQSSPTEQAWTMRHAFDAILDGSVEARPLSSSIDRSAGDYGVMDWSKGLPSRPRWFSLDDGVMGGMSSSSWRWDSDEQAAVFQGSVTTANYGGFASIRSEPWGGWGFGQASGMRLNLKGDGRLYKMTAKTDNSIDGITYQHDFATSGQWQTVDLRFADFKPNIRGRVVSGQPPLRGSQIRQLGLMVSKFSDVGGTTAGFKTGPFRLAVRGLRGLI